MNILDKCLDDYDQLIKNRPDLFKQNTELLIETNLNKLRSYALQKEINIGVIYSSPYHLFVVDLVHCGDFDYFLYERLIPTAQGIATVMLTRYQGKFVLLEQFRHPLRDFQLACPRGFGTDNLTGEENAKQELFEEVGAKVTSLKYLGTSYMDSGVMAKKVAFYLCDIGNVILKPHYEGIQNIHYFKESELEEKILNEDINDSFTLTAYLFYKLKAESIHI